MKRLIAILFCLAQPALAAITVDSQESAGGGHRNVTTSPLTWSFTNTAGTKLVCGFVVTEISGGSGVTMSTPTYNGVTMSNAGVQKNFSGNPANNITAIYYLDSPATGANTVSIAYTWGNTGRMLGGCISFQGMNTGVGSFTSGSGTTGTTATAGSITTASGNYIFACGGWGSGAGGTAGGSFTRTYLTNGSSGTSGDDLLGEYFSSAGGSTSPTFTWTGSDSWGIVAAEFTATGGAASSGFDKRRKLMRYYE